MAVIPHTISNPGVLLLSFAGVLVLFFVSSVFCVSFTGVCALFPDAGCILVLVAVLLPVTLFSSLALTTVARPFSSLALTTVARPFSSLLWLLPPSLPLELVAFSSESSESSKSSEPRESYESSESAESTVIIVVFESVPAELLTVRLAVYVPGMLYV